MKKIIAGLFAAVTVFSLVPTIDCSIASSAENAEGKKVEYVTIHEKQGAAIAEDGSLYTWGSNWSGQLGDGTTESSYIPKKIMNDVKFVALDESVSAAITNDGSLYTWGNSFGSRLGNYGYETDAGGSLPKKVLDNVKYVDVDNSTFLAITEDGSLYAWGLNFQGQLGNGVYDSGEIPETNIIPTKILENVKSVDIDLSFCAAVTESGELYTWGGNWVGQLGNGTNEDCYIPTKIMDNVKEVDICGYHWAGTGLPIGWGEFYGAAITENGDLYTWGSNKYGQLGDGTNEYAFAPKKIMENVADVDLNYCFSAAIKENGELYTWGYGYRYIEEEFIDTCNNPVKTFDNVKSVSLGIFNALITTNDELYTWGSNYYGQLGNGTTETTDECLVPQKIMEDVKISCHNNIVLLDEPYLWSAVVNKDGELYTWGNNWYGYLGNGTTEDCTVPTRIIISDTPTLPLGDINGDSTVDASDASNVLAVYALVSTGKESELTAEQIAAADVNKDGTIDASDASLILAYYAHISTGGTGTLEEYLNS